MNMAAKNSEKHQMHRKENMKGNQSSEFKCYKVESNLGKMCTICYLTIKNHGI